MKLVITLDRFEIKYDEDDDEFDVERSLTTQNNNDEKKPNVSTIGTLLNFTENSSSQKNGLMIWKHEDNNFERVELTDIDNSKT